MTFEEFVAEGERKKRIAETEEPSLGSVFKAAISTTVTGGSTFFDMVDNKHMAPVNDGDDNFPLTKEFKDTVSKSGLSVDEIKSLYEAKNLPYLQHLITSKQRYFNNVETLEKAGATGLLVEGFTSLADVPSWLVGGAVFKGAKVAKTALNINRAGANKMYNLASSGIATGTAVGTSEAIIQNEAGVTETDRIENAALFGTAFGIGLPLLGTTISTVSTGAGRQAIAGNINTVLENIPGTGSLRGFFSLSSADQLIHDSSGGMFADIGNKATTRTTAAKDANGSFITSSEDTAMDYRETVVESEISRLHYGVLENSQRSGVKIEEQSLIDGREWSDFRNQVEQTTRYEVGRRTDDELVALYKEATGVQELPHEVKAAKVNDTFNKRVEEATKVADRNISILNTQKNKLIKDSVLDFERNLEATKTEQIKVVDNKVNGISLKLDNTINLLDEAQASLADINKRFKNPAMLGIGESKSTAKTVASLEKKIASLETKIQDYTTKLVEANKARAEADNLRIKANEEEILNLTERVNKQFKANENIHTKARDKAIKAAEKERDKALPTREDLPKDLYDVVTAHIKKNKFDDDTFVVPQHLQYIQDFYSKFGEDATKYGLRGIAGKDSRGYGHVKWNTDYILANPQRAREQMKEMLLDDELTKAMLARNEVTVDEVTEIADNMVSAIEHKDYIRSFIDGSKGVSSTSAVKQRVLRANTALHPEMLVNDISVIGYEYADRIGGRLALKKTYGLDADHNKTLAENINDYLDKAVKDSQARGFSKKQIEKDVANARAVFETIQGSRKYNKDPDALVNKTVRMLKKGSGALFNAGFVKYAVVEPTVAIFRYGMKPVLDNYIPAIKMAKEQISNAAPTDPILKLYRQAGLSIQMQRGAKYDKYDNFEVVPSTGKVEMFLDKASHYGRKYSGFNYVNDVNDFIAGGAALHELQTVMRRPTDLTAGEASRMAKYGLSSDDLAKISRENLIVENTGNVKDWNIDNWSDKELAARFVRYLGRATRDTIMRADGTRVHRWQSDVNNPISTLALQFTQMPTALYERLLLPLGDELSTRTFVGTFTAIGTMYTMLELEDMAMVKAGAKDERDTHEQLLVRAITRTPMAGIIPNFIDTGLMLTGNSPLGNSYTPRGDLMSTFGGAGYSTGNRVFKALQGLGDGFSGTDASNMLKLVPIINSLPVFNVGMKSLEHQLKVEDKLKTDVDVNYDKPLYEYLK